MKSPGKRGIDSRFLADRFKCVEFFSRTLRGCGTPLGVVNHEYFVLPIRSGGQRPPQILLATNGLERRPTVSSRIDKK